MMKKLCCAVLAMLLILCCASVLAEQCKYYHEDSPCEPKWWVDKKNMMHARACFYHVEEKEDVESHVLITPWEACTLDEGGVCTGCGVDYEPDLTEEDYYIIMLESFYAMSNGGWPLDTVMDGDRMTVAYKSELFDFLDECNRAYQESAKGTAEIALVKGDDGWAVQVSEVGPVPFLQWRDWMTIGQISVEGDTATVKITLCETDEYVLRAGADLPEVPLLPEGVTECTPYLSSYYCSCGFYTTDRSKVKAYFSATEHWWVCPDCGKDNGRDNHLSLCDTPNACRICGVGSIDAIIAHNSKLGTVAAYDQYTHWDACAGCGEPTEMTEYRAHRESCDARGVCYECGAKDVTFKYFDHVFGGTEYEHDATHHWYTCTGCGEQNKVLHSLSCYEPDADPNTCYMCNAEGVTIGEYYHNYDGSSYRSISATQHVICCAGCGAADPAYAPDDHIADCRTPDVCCFCLETGVTMSNYFHEGDMQMGYDETHHWLTCSACDYQVAGRREAHMVECTKPGECFCGATGLAFDPSYHSNVDNDSYAWDEDTCWNVCLDCGDKANVMEHEAWRCGKDIRCERCGQKNVNIKVGSHSFDEYGSVGVYFYNAEEHWATCSRCGEEKHEPHAFYNEDNGCVRCEYEKPAYVSGDADGSGKVDIMDALAVLQAAVGWDVHVDLDAADVDDSGEVDILDALRILQYSVGWGVELL